jgi:5-methylcytosine-specific restriction endonuclease McrA
MPYDPLKTHAVRQMVAIVQRDEADGVWRCSYCRIELVRMDIWPWAWDKPRPERDHVIPRSAGGSGRLANMALACQGCNVRKGPNSPEVLPADWHLWRERVA